MFVQLIEIEFSNRIMAKLLKLSILQITMKMNLSTKRTTHYDTLQISPNATHNEVKSAYYKLTLQYHPDKNKSDSAKQMFQDIADAYEVLGNYQLRKQYDRTIAVKFRDVNQMQRPQVTRAEPFKGNIYNFDEWTRSHYSKTFRSDQKRKDSYRMHLERQKVNAKEEENNNIVLPVVIAVCSLMLFIRYYIEEKNDVPLKEKKN
ncbi:uncharacterized protein LOC143186188 [Calliopsis andreniformis]|uniref:uncharacterized protein LOC143186188 n=1 Tax=Calliopsis andreniformis TaxID=337506 RepID=UPI003FCD32D1